MNSEVLITIIQVVGGVLTLFVGYLIWLFKRHKETKEELKTTKRKMEVALEEAKDLRLHNRVSESLLTLTTTMKIITSVQTIFDQTKADRFLLIFAINGKKHFNWTTVFFEKHKHSDHDINAVVRYRRVKVDAVYRGILKHTENYGAFVVDVEEMADSVLKDIYTSEGVKHSIFRHLLRYSLDDNNDVLLFSTLGTHVDETFSKKEMTVSKLEYESNIVPAMIEVLENSNPSLD